MNELEKRNEKKKEMNQKKEMKRMRHEIFNEFYLILEQTIF